jgi:hypothetical protein
MPRISRPNRRTSSTSFTAVTIGAWFALTITVATLCLTLLGYGHDLAYLEAAGLRPEELQRTPLDFLLRSWHPLIHLLTNLNKLNELEFHREFWVEVWWKVWWLILLLPLLTAIVAWYVSSKPWRWFRTFIRFLCPRWLNMPDCLKRVLVNLKSRRKKIVAQWPSWHSAPLRRWGYLGWLAGPVIFGLQAFSLGIAYFAIGFGALLVSFIPLMSVSSGMTSAQQEVLNPIGCLGQKLKKNDNVERQARCLLVKRDGKEVARGYLVDYGAGRVFLYQPCTKQPISLSLERTTIEQVNTLEFASPGKGCRPSLSLS